LKKRKKRKKKGKTVYAIISLATSILPVVVGITGLMTWIASITDIAESERQTFQYESKQLESSIQYAQDLLPTCDMSINNKSRINVELQRSMNELQLNNDIETSRSIYENVKNDLVNCARPLLPEPPAPMMSPSRETLPMIEDSGILFLIIIGSLGSLAVISVIYGIKWYRSRKEVGVSDASTSMNQKS
jgi:hypothetical protein